MRWLLLMLVSTSLYAQDWEVHIPIVSQHLISQTFWYDKNITDDVICNGSTCTTKGRYTNFNPGFVVYRYHEDFKIGGGILRNSLGELTYLYGVGYEYKNAGIEVGLATGYEKQTGADPIMPMYSIYYRLWMFKLILNHEIINLGLSVRF